MRDLSGLIPTEPSPRLKAARERRAKRRDAMEKNWTQMVEEAYLVEAGLSSLHNRAIRNRLAPMTIRALERAGKVLAGAVLAVEDDPLQVVVRPKNRKKKGAT